MINWDMFNSSEKTIILFTASMATPFLIGMALYFLLNPTRGLLVQNKEE